VFAGGTASAGSASSSYGYGLEYREALGANLAASFGYLNEGHLIGHHRDGLALQVLGKTSRWQEHFELSLGLGPYAFFDTQQAPQLPGYRDLHGIAAALTGALTYYSGNRWFARLSVTQIEAFRDVSTHMLQLGVGYTPQTLFDSEETREHPERFENSRPKSELVVFMGESILNSLASHKSANFGVEYHGPLAQHVELSGAWLSEAEGKQGRHAALLGEAWLVNRFLSHEFTVGVGLGPHVALQSYRLDDGRPGERLMGVVSLMAHIQITRSLAARVELHRNVTANSQDCDVATTGLAWSFGN